MIKLKDLDTSEDILVIGAHKKTIYTTMLMNGTYDVIMCINVEGCTYAQIKANIDAFIRSAKSRPTHKFWITGSLGDPVDIAPMFEESPSNCLLPLSWKLFISNTDKHSWWYA